MPMRHVRCRPGVGSENDLRTNTIQLRDIAAGKRLRPCPQPLACGAVDVFHRTGETLAVIGFPQARAMASAHRPLAREMVLADGGELPRAFSFGTVAFAPHDNGLPCTPSGGEILLLETLTGQQSRHSQGLKASSTVWLFAR